MKKKNKKKNFTVVKKNMKFKLSLIEKLMKNTLAFNYLKKIVAVEAKFKAFKNLC